MKQDSQSNVEQDPKGWLWTYLRQQRWRFAAAVIVGTLAAACAGGLLFTSGYLISRSAMQPYNILMVYVPIVLVRAFGFGKAIIQYCERLISHDTVLRILAAMRLRLYRALEPQAAHVRSRYQTGDLLGLLAEDIEQLQNVYLRLALPAATAVLIYGAAIAWLGLMDGAFALFMALYLGFLLFTVPVLALLFSRRSRQRYTKERSEMYREVTDSVFGMSDWILSGRSKRWLGSFRKRQASMLESERQIRRSEWRIEWIMQLFVGGAVVCIALWAGSMSAAGRFAPEWIAAYVFITFPLLETFIRAGQAVITAPDYRASLTRLQAVEQQGQLDKLHAASRTTRTVNSLNPVSGDAAHEVEAGRRRAAAIQIERVSYRYPGSQKMSISDLTLDVPAGARIALLGRSGGGKSTLFKLLQGELQPDEGSILIDGLPASEARMRGAFAVMNQQPYLFNTTIAGNIRLGRPEASDDEVRAAAEQAGLGPLLSQLASGIDTAVRETGSRFSGGERQRIALARILLQDRPVVLLDEPTVGLDPIIEHQLIETLHHALSGKTIIWITHHLSGMEQMDRILFMEQGRIAMQGTHEEMYRSEERYRRLYELDRP